MKGLWQFLLKHASISSSMYVYVYIYIDERLQMKSLVSGGCFTEIWVLRRLKGQRLRVSVNIFKPSLPEPYGSKVPKYRVLGVSILGIVVMVLDTYLLFGSFGPLGLGIAWLV